MSANRIVKAYMPRAMAEQIESVGVARVLAAGLEALTTAPQPEAVAIPENLEAMLKAELLDLAEGLGLTSLTDYNTKAEIITAIRGAQ